MPTTASFDCHPLPQLPKYQQLFRPLDGSQKAMASKLTDSSKFKVHITVKSDTDILAVVFFICLFCSFSFYLIFYLLFFFFFFVFFLILFIDLRTCNSIYILTRAQHSQASEIRVCNKKYFPYFSIKTYAMATQKYSLIKAFFCENPKQMLNFQPKVKLWAQKRTDSMRRLLCALKTNVQTD